MASRSSDNGQNDGPKDGKPDAQDEVLIREIDDAVRQGEMEDFMDRFGKPLLVLVVGGLLAFGGYLFWDNRNEAAMEKDSEDLIAALDQVKAGNLDSADSAAANLAERGAGQGASATMLRAGIALEKENNAEAATLFNEVADSTDAPPALRDLAKIRAVTATFDERKPAEVIAELSELAVPGNPWFGSAGELVAMAHLEAGDRDKAGAMFAEIAKSEDVPESLRTRSRQMAGLLGVDAIEDVDELLEEQGIETAAAEERAAGGEAP